MIHLEKMIMVKMTGQDEHGCNGHNKNKENGFPAAIRQLRFFDVWLAGGKKMRFYKHGNFKKQPAKKKPEKHSGKYIERVVDAKINPGVTN